MFNLITSGAHLLCKVVLFSIRTIICMVKIKLSGLFYSYILKETAFLSTIVVNGPKTAQSTTIRRLNPDRIFFFLNMENCNQAKIL